MGAGLSNLSVDKHKNITATSSHQQEHDIIKQQLVLSTGMKSPQERQQQERQQQERQQQERQQQERQQQSSGKRKVLRVSFTEADLPSRQQRAEVNEYTKPPSTSQQRNQSRDKRQTRPVSMPSYGTRIKYVDTPTSNGHSNGYSSHKKPQQAGTNGYVNGYNGADKTCTSYRPTHLPPHVSASKYDMSRGGSDHILSNNSAAHYKDKTDSGKRYSRYKSNDHLSNQSLHPNSAGSEGHRSSTLTRRQHRARSASPGHRDRVVIQTPLSRAELENLKNVIRTAQKSSKSNGRKPRLFGSSDSVNHRTADRMTSFVIGRPAKFAPGAFGDIGTFKAISSVNDQLYICGVMALKEEKVKALGINCVINATLEWPALNIPGLETVKIVIDDVPSANLAPYFDRTADKIHDVVRRGGKALVHCMAGISRSSSLCIAYLMKYKGLTLQQAYSHMKAKRPLIRPNDGFWRQLISYERDLKRRKQEAAYARNKEETTPKTGSAVFPKSHQALSSSHVDNPSLTVRQLSSARGGPPSLHTNNQTSSAHPAHPAQQGIVTSRYPDRGYYSKAPHSSLNLNAGVTRNPTLSSGPHKLSTLRSSGSGTVRLQPNNQREIAVRAMKSNRGQHWSTTYGSDYSRRLP